MKHRTRMWLAGGLITFAFLSACDDDSISGPQHVAEAPFAYTVSVAGQSALDLEAITGSVQITGTTSGPEVRIEGRRRVKAFSQAEADARLEHLEVSIVESQDAITVMTLQPSQSNGINYEVEYEIWAPIGMNLRVDQVTGAILIQSAHGEVGIRNVTGSVVLEDVLGSVDVQVITGSIAGSLTLRPGGTVGLNVVTGTIVLSIPTTTSARLKASVATGRLSFTGLDIVDRDHRENVVMCILGGGDGAIDLSSVTGNVTVTGR